MLGSSIKRLENIHENHKTKLRVGGNCGFGHFHLVSSVLLLPRHSRARTNETLNVRIIIRVDKATTRTTLSERDVGHLDGILCGIEFNGETERETVSLSFGHFGWFVVLDEWIVGWIPITIRAAASR